MTEQPKVRANSHAFDASIGRLTESMLWPTEPRTTVCGVEQVLQLQYRVRWLSDDVNVRNDAAPVTVQLAGFSCSLSGETLIAEPSSDYSSVDAARAALEPALHAWEASSELNQGLRFSFKYTGSAVHDVASSQQRAVAIDDVVALSDALQVSRVLGEFPKPDPSLPTEGSVAYELRLPGGEHNGKAVSGFPVPVMPF
jgi:hypothetical protein